MPDEKRGRGIFSPADREYLSDPEQYRNDKHRQTVHERENAIRERVENAVFDFALLGENLNSDVYDDLFEVDTDGTWRTPEVNTSLPFGVVFLLRASLAVDPTDRARRFYGDINEALEPFLSNVERGITVYLSEYQGIKANIDVSVSATEKEPIDQYADRLAEQKESLTGSDRLEAVAHLARAGYSDEEIMNRIGDVSDSESAE